MLGEFLGKVAWFYMKGQVNSEHMEYFMAG